MLTENMNMRLQWMGGARQQDRMNEDKLRTLKKALLYSYQAITLENEEGKQFRALLNPDKLKNDYDQKTLSIPFNDICLNEERIGTTTEGLQPTGISTGQVFRNVDNDTYWLIYLRNLEETAYFRAEVRRCKEEVEINGHKYKVYVRGPVETKIQWNQKKGDNWNNLNYSLLMYITENEETREFFHRFSKIKVRGKPYECQVQDSFAADDIIEVVLLETYDNPLEDQEGIPAVEEIIPAENEPQIKGPSYVGPYSINEYEISNIALGGTWKKDSANVKFISGENGKVNIEILTGKAFKFNLSYTVDEQTVTKQINVESF